MSTAQGYTFVQRLYDSPRTQTHRAVRNRDGQSVIIKSLTSQHPTATQLARFNFAAELQKTFDHPGIIKILDTSTSPSPYLVMEDTGAIPLSDFLNRQPGQTLPIDAFLDIAMQLAAALGEIHGHHVIHKDLHPGNILVHPQTGHTQIIDFDLSTLLSREQPSLKPLEALDGVLAFMSPEQTGRMNRALDERSDFYSLGVLFYWLLAGKLPFAEDSAIAMVHAHIARLARPLELQRSDIPAPLARLIDKLMAKNAEARYQSAAGLQYDLHECHRQWRDTQTIADFPLAQQDFSTRLQISQKLYGREPQIAQLLNAFQQARQGHPQLLTVAGYAGIGKSSLVQEAHKPIATYGGWFIVGKFDQFKRNIPYSALHDAIKTWVQLVVAEGGVTLTQRRNTLHKALGANARVLIDFQADMALLLGTLPPVPSLGPQETQNRFHRVMQQFIGSVTQQQPLVMFLDDLQWADRGTLDLLKVLMSDSHHQLLLIVAYRDNEVSDTHPTRLTLRAIQQDMSATPERCHALELAPLPLTELENLLTDTLHRHTGIAPLAQLIMDKTAGNPFFVNEFLRTLYSDGLIHFNATQHQWQWDLQLIQAQAITDNVVDLMLGKMHKLPKDTQQLLQLAACIGSRFDLSTLATLAAATNTDVASTLWPALQAGLLLQDAAPWHACTSAVDPTDTLRPPASEDSQLTRYHFLHDRMLQAAYPSQDEALRQRTHLAIGRLLQARPAPHRSEDLFTIAEHLNASRALLTTETERLALAELNSDAAQRAKTASVWHAASRHAAVARELLPDDAWQRCYALAARIYPQSVECEILNGNSEVAEPLAEETLQKLHDDDEKARVCLVLLNSNIIRGNRDYAILKGIAGLHHCGIDIPATAAALEEALRAVQQPLALALSSGALAEKIHVADHLPPRTAVAFGLLGGLLLVSYVSGRQALNTLLGCKGMQLLLEVGLCDESAAILAQYAVIPLMNGNPDMAFALISQALNYANNARNKGACLQVYLFSGSVVWPHFRPFQEAIEQQWQGFHTGLEYGDLSSAVGCFSNIAVNRFAKGDALADVTTHLEQLGELMNRYKLSVSAGRHYQRLINMLGQPDLKDQLNEASFSPAEWQVISNSTLLGFVQHLRLQWYFWSEQTDAAVTQLPLAESTLALMPGFFTNIDHLLIKGMLLSHTYSAQSPAGQNSAMEALLEIRNQFASMAARCPVNFEHKYLLLCAEIARLQRQTQDSISHYRNAVRAARKEAFLQYEALGNELLGRFLVSLGWTDFATLSLKEAHYAYGRWGCKVKQQILVQAFPELIGMLVTEQTPTRETPTSSISSTGFRASSQLDMESIVKSTQAISSELQLEQLLSKMLHIMIENAGAQSASLVLNQQGVLRLEARVNADTDSIVAESVSQARPLDDTAPVPADLIRYVLLTGTPLLLQDVALSDAWSRNPYIARYQPQSILCLPIHYRDALTGVLYLENTLTPHAFTDERLQVLQMLLTQASISLENARLFDEIQTLNSDLEHKVEQRTAELRTVNKELEAFSYSVSHDLRGPLRNINGFSKMLMDQYRDVIGVDGQDLLNRVCRNTEKMAQLINGLLELSKVTRCELNLSDVDLASLAKSICEELQAQNPQQTLIWHCIDHASVRGDARLLASALENLLNNAWKYSSKTAQAQVQFGVEQQDGKTVYFIRDNGAGFDMRYIGKLFTSFQRLHHEREFSGTGIGLATVQRIIQRHGGDIWAEAEVGQGATFYFTLGG